MLLPSDGLAHELVPGRLLPRWLGEADIPLVDAIVDTISRFDGRSVADAEILARAHFAPLARRASVPTRLVEAIWAIERRRWTAWIDAPTLPEELRDVLFELAVRLPRAEAIACAAARLGIEPDVVMGSLFADRRRRRIWVAPAERPPAADLVARYNLALVQSLLAHSMEVDVTIDGEPDSLIAAAKRDGLLARFERASGQYDGTAPTRLEIAGPLAIVHDTARYVRILARFVPAIFATPGWALRARLVLSERSVELALDRHGAISFAAAPPAPPEERLARRVSRVLRSAGVRIDRRPGVLRSRTTLVLPDFALELPPPPRVDGASGPSVGGRVFVDVVPFATPQHLAAKAAAIAMLDVPIVVCVDDRFVGGAASPLPWLVPYRREIDAWTLYEAARRALDKWLTRASSSPVPLSSPAPSSSPVLLSSPAPSSSPPGPLPRARTPPPARA